MKSPGFVKRGWLYIFLFLLWEMGLNLSFIEGKKFDFQKRVRGNIFIFCEMQNLGFSAKFS